MSKVYFSERQHFNQWWIWLILILLSGFWIWQFVQQIIMGIPLGNNPAPNVVVFLIGIFPVLGILLFRFMTLETKIDESGIYYRFSPFQKKFKIIKPDDLARFEVKKYKPVREYGGWGIRYGSTKNGDAYNVKGNMGVLFEFKKGRKFMLGTQNPEAIRSALNKLMDNNRTTT